MDRIIAPFRDAILMVKEGLLAKGTSIRIYANVVPFFKSHWLRALWLFLGVLVLSLLSLPSPKIIAWIFDQVLFTNNVKLLTIGVCLLIGIAGLNCIISFLVNYNFSVLCQKVLTEIKKELLGKLLRLPVSYFDKTQTGYIVSRIGEVSALGNLFSASTINLFIKMIEILLCVVVMFQANWQLTLIVLSGIPFFVFMSKLTSAGTQATIVKSMEQSALASMNMQESLTGVEQIKLLGREQAEVNKAYLRIQAAAKAQIRQTFILSLFKEGGFFLSSCMNFIILYAAVLLIMKQSLSMGQFMMMTAYSARVLMNAQFITSTWVSLRMMGVAMERIFAISSLVAEDEDTQRTINLQRPQGRLVFENVSFHYTDGYQVLNTTSFQIEPGEKTLICGESGSGKSTILKLILGMYNPQNGRILLDGIPTDCLTLSSLRGCISVVSQNVFLFNDTVMNNILYGCPNATRTDAIEAAKRARAHEFIVEMEDGYETFVGENGARLSGGQAQRLAIARGIVRKARIYFFDEATASLDQENALLVTEAITELVSNNTCVVISHHVNPGWEKRFNKVLMLKAGTIDIEEKANLSSERVSII